MSILHRAWLFLQPGLDERAQALRNAQEAIEIAQSTTEMWKLIAREGWGFALDHALAHRIHCEQPEIDLRDDLDASICTLKDKLAQIEEIVV